MRYGPNNIYFLSLSLRTKKHSLKLENGTVGKIKQQGVTPYRPVLANSLGVRFKILDSMCMFC